MKIRPYESAQESSHGDTALRRVTEEMAEMGYHLAFIAAKELLLLADPLSKDELESRGTSGPRHRG